MPDDLRGAASSSLPLTQAQLGVLQGQRMAGDDRVFYAGECTTFDGVFDAAAFERALHATLGEASALHLRVAERDGQPRQFATRPHLPTLVPLDFGNASEAELAAELSRQMERPFDLRNGPLYDHVLYRLAPTRHVWLHRAHHLVLDGYGFQLIARRIAEHYEAALGGTPARVAAFGDLRPVVEADIAYQASPARETDRRFWLDTLAGLEPVSLCAQRTPGIGRGRRIGGTLPAALTSRLKARAAELGLSWPELLIAGFAGYLATHGHGRDVVLGMPVMQRLGSVAARTPCTVMNVMPLPVPQARTQSLSALALSLRVSMPRLRPHQRYRFEHLEGDLEEAGYAHGLLGTEINVMPFEAPLRFGACEAHTRILAAGPVEDLAAIFTARGDDVGFDLDGRPENYAAAQLQAHWRGVCEFLQRALERIDLRVDAL